MSAYASNDIKIIYSKVMKRLSITKQTQWMSISPTTFEILLSLAREDIEYKKISISENGEEIEIINLLGNFVLNSTIKAMSSSIVFKASEMRDLIKNSKSIVNYIKMKENEERKNGVKLFPTVINANDRTTAKKRKYPHTNKIVCTGK